MESVATIKTNLINRIKNSENLEFLKALQTIFDATEKKAYPLSTAEENMLNERHESIQKGEYIAHDNAVTDLKQWLKNK